MIQTDSRRNLFAAPGGKCVPLQQILEVEALTAAHSISYLELRLKVIAQINSVPLFTAETAESLNGCSNTD